MEDSIKIDHSKLGNIAYGESISLLLKDKYNGLKIVDVQYNYFSETFVFVLDNGERVDVDLYNEEEE